MFRSRIARASFPHVVARFAGLLAQAFRQHRRDRALLAHLDPRDVRDLGLSPVQVDYAVVADQPLRPTRLRRLWRAAERSLGIPSLADPPRQWFAFDPTQAGPLGEIARR
jgi:uncharacterized protein YjiS (DUF1127 family)